MPRKPAKKSHAFRQKLLSHLTEDNAHAGFDASVKDFPAIVTMDAHGNSLHRDIEQESGTHLEASLA